MKNIINTLPLDQLETGKISHATFCAKGRFYTFAPALDSLEFMRLYPDHKRIQSILDSSGSSWLSRAYLFFTADCFDPPVYLQPGSSFEDAYESYVDNDESLIIPPEDYKDYDVESDSPTCGFIQAGTPSTIAARSWTVPPCARPRATLKGGSFNPMPPPDSEPETLLLWLVSIMGLSGD